MLAVRKLYGVVIIKGQQCRSLLNIKKPFLQKDVGHVKAKKIRFLLITRGGVIFRFLAWTIFLIFLLVMVDRGYCEL